MTYDPFTGLMPRHVRPIIYAIAAVPESALIALLWAVSPAGVAL